MSEQEHQEQETPTRVTDKRGQKKEQPPLPTAEELLASTSERTIPMAEETEFARQQREAEEDARRAAEFDALPEEEKQRILAQQAAEAEGGLPFAGGGIQTDGESVRELLTVFVVEIDLDGTATAKPMEMFEPTKVTYEHTVTPRMMYRSCAEIMLDIEAAETSHLTLHMMRTVGEQAAAAQRAQMLEKQLAQRGVRGRRH